MKKEKKTIKTPREIALPKVPSEIKISDVSYFFRRFEKALPPMIGRGDKAVFPVYAIFARDDWTEVSLFANNPLLIDRRTASGKPRRNHHRH